MEGTCQADEVLSLISSFVGSTSRSNNPLVQKPIISASKEVVWTESNFKHDIDNTNDKTNDNNNNMDEKHRTKVKIIIFTKDRPWQLQQLLYSMKLDTVPEDTTTNTTISPITITIICHISSIEFKHGYSQVCQEMNKYTNSITLHWFYESSNHTEMDPTTTTTSTTTSTSCSCSFAHLLEKAILHHYHHHHHNYDDNDDDHDTNVEPTSSDSTLVMFLTDDCILLKPLQQILLVAKDILIKEEIIAFCSRLHPGITFSQTRNQISPPPIRHMKFHQCDMEWNTTNAIVYPINVATMEFSYPFDLSGGIYKQKDVIQLMKDIRQQNLVGTYSHPNYLEINGNIVLSSKCTNRKFLSIPTTPSLLILAINRVQDVCHAPLATDDPLWTTHALLSFLDGGKMIDIDEYKKCMYNTSHIGDVWLKRNDDSTQNTMDSSHPDVDDDDDHVYKISVLIPIRTGPPKAASLAILSIMNECVMDESVMPMQIVIVDDRCNDGSIDAMMEEANMFGISKGFDTKVFDWRYNKVQDSISPFQHNNEKCIHIYLCKCFKPGLGAALNHGLTYCKSEFVARMDADDISCPFRLCRQLSLLKKDLQTHVIGTTMVIFSNCKLSSSNAIDFHGSLVLPHDLTQRHGILSTSIQPSEAGFVDWAMMFSCVLSHPTVMFRKRFIQNNGGYMEESCVTEDYELWLRLQKRQAKCMKSLPMIGLCHRKHTSRSNSDMRKVQQRNESIKLSHDIMMECLDPTTNEYSIHHVHVLKFPKDVTDLDILNQSVEMLVQLEKTFLQKRKDTLAPNEISLIRHDCTERIGELATIGIQKFGRDASKGFAWYAWSDRDPNRQLERVTLLLSCT